MANKSNLKKMVTALKNKIINQLHSVNLKELVGIARFVGIRVSPELEEKSKSEK